MFQAAGQSCAWQLLGPSIPYGTGTGQWASAVGHSDPLRADSVIYATQEFETAANIHCSCGFIKLAEFGVVGQKTISVIKPVTK